MGLLLTGSVVFVYGGTHQSLSCHISLTNQVSPCALKQPRFEIKDLL